MEENINQIPRESAQKDVNAVNIVFLALVLLPEILMACGVGKLIGNYTALLLFSQAIYVLPVLVYLFFIKKSAEPCRFRKIRITDVLLCLVIYICIMPLLMLLNTVSMLYSSNEISGTMVGLSSEIPYPVALVVVALIPAFCEELTYRGVFYNTYRKVNPLLAVIMSGALFGFLHGNLNQITYAVVLGMVFALIVEATDSSFSSMIVHFMVNAFSTTLIYVIPKLTESLKTAIEEAEEAGGTDAADLFRQILGSEDATLESALEASQNLSTQTILSSIIIYLFPAAVGAYLAFLLLRFIARRNGRWERICSTFKHPVKNGRIFTWALITAFVLLIGTIVFNELVSRGVIVL